MIQEILRLKELGLSKRMIAKALDCSRNTVDKYLADSAGEAAASAAANYQAPWSANVAWEKVHGETCKGTALSEVWEEACQTSDELRICP